MLQLEVGGHRYRIAAGEMTVGSDSGCTVPLTGEGVFARHAVVSGTTDGAMAIRRLLPEAEVLVNRVRLGDEPTPVLRGDKIQIGPHELLVVDPDSPGDGRLVSLTDGREYGIGTDPLVIGRDAACDVVVGGSDVSRRHSEVRRSSSGWIVVDASSNGTFVNGERVHGERLLARDDVVRVGADEFRFSPGAPIEPPVEPLPVEPLPAEPPPGAAERLQHTLHGIPIQRHRSTAAATPVARDRPLASLLVRSGAMKGDRLPIYASAVKIGRAEFNDVVLRDPSVGVTHAKLERRGVVWILTDLRSTSGTLVDDEPAAGEVAVGPGATIRFGDVALLFEPLDDGVPAEAASETPAAGQLSDRAAGDAQPPAAGSAPRPSRPVARRPAGPPGVEKRGLPGWVLWASLGALAAAITYALLLT